MGLTLCPEENDCRKIMYTYTLKRGIAMEMEYVSEFNEKTGIVTGAASGIGRATAIYLAKLGAKIAIFDLDEARLAETAGEITAAGYKAPIQLPLDISKEQDVIAAVASAANTLGSIDFLVNSAGILRRTPFLEIETSEWDLMINVNLRAQYVICREVLRHMVPRKTGAIVNVASLAGRSCSLLGGAHYTTVKHALVGFSRHLAREFAATGIRINAFCPGATRTPMVENSTSTEELKRLDAAIPRGTVADPAEHARVIGFMLSDAAINVIGACIDSNGGSLMI